MMPGSVCFRLHSYKSAAYFLGNFTSLCRVIDKDDLIRFNPFIRDNSQKVLFLIPGTP